MRRGAIVVGVALLVALGGCIDRLVGSDPASNPAALFDLVWSDFDRNYAFFDYKGIDWNAIHAKYATRAQAARTPTEVAPVIGDMFKELNDMHVDLTFSGVTYRSIDFSTIHTYFSASTIIRSYVPSSTQTPSKNIRYGKLSSDVGWIWIPSFGGDGWADEIDQAIAGLGSVTGLVIDVRNNGGGSTNNSDPIAGRFVTQARVFSYVKFRDGPRHSDFTPLRSRAVKPEGRHFSGRVVVLTNRLCASATESFLLGVRTNSAIVFVGDTTAGALGNPMTRELPNGWVYRVPQWIQYDANKGNLENIGIAPDVVVRMTAADSTVGRDPQLEAALALAKPPA